MWNYSKFCSLVPLTLCYTLPTNDDSGCSTPSLCQQPNPLLTRMLLYKADYLVSLLTKWSALAYHGKFVFLCSVTRFNTRIQK